MTVHQATTHPLSAAPAPQRLRKTLAALAVATILAGTVSAAALTAGPAQAATQTCNTPEFADVRHDSSYYEAVTWLRCAGIGTGSANGSFDPTKKVTRGEAAEMLYRFSGQTHRPGTQQDFKDVPTSHSAFTAVSWMQEKGYTIGYANGTLGIDKPISRGGQAALLYWMAGQTGYRAPSTAPFRDVKKNSSFYEASAWLQGTGRVTGYADGTFRPGRDITRGEMAKFLYAAQSRANGAPPADQVPAPTVSSTVNATGGSGGTYQDAKSLSYRNGTSTSQYHLYAEHLDGATPHGIIVFLHGDGADEFLDPEGTMVAAYAELARQHELMLVVPRTPDRSSNTWWTKPASGKYAADLLKDLGDQYNLDLNQVYWAGYSGGADTIAEQMLNAHSAGWTGGAAVIVAGGPAYGLDQPARPIAAGLKENFPMHWVVGARDTPAAGGSSGDYDALKAARNGHAFYTGQGLETSLTVVPGLDHYTIAPHGPATLAKILENR